MSEYMYDLVLRDMMILTMNGDRQFFSRGTVAVNGDRIVEIGKKLTGAGREEIHLPHGLIMPGLINGHTHHTLTRGIAEDLKLMDWLEKICFPLDAQYTPATMEASSKMNQMEHIRFGTTTFVDIYRYPETVARVAEQTGVRAVLTPQIIDEPADAGESFEGSVELFRKWHGRADGRISVWMGIHAPYSNTLETYCKASEFARENGIGMHTHLAETEDEVRMFNEQYGKSSIKVLDESGALQPHMIAAHCIHVSDEDIDILGRNNVTAIYNPVSNMKTASGIAPIEKLQRRGVRTTIGTDSNLSNNNLDMFEEMKIGGLLQKLGNSNAASLPCYDLLEMATVRGAEALKMEEEIGSVEKGKKADLIVLDFDSPHLRPLFTGEINNLEEHIVYSANGNDVDTTIVNGKVLMKNREVRTVDREKMYEQVQKESSDLIRRAGIEDKVRK